LKQFKSASVISLKSKLFFNGCLETGCGISLFKKERSERRQQWVDKIYAWH
jgi:hypothetical protein